MELLQVKDLTFRYPGADRDALSGVSLSVREGEFAVLCGSSGCGKTTLLKLIKREISPFGDLRGEIYYGGEPLASVDGRRAAAEIGYVTQDPDDGIVTDTVWHELSFGLENLGAAPEAIRRRVGEMASYFGLEGCFRAKTDELSGGQKQLLCLASVMVMQPRLLLLDEPTSRLDPIAAEEFTATVSRLNRELGITVILAEHRLGGVLPGADRVLLMEGGRLMFDGAPRMLGELEGAERLSIYGGLPAPVRIARALGERVCPLTVREGRELLESRFRPEAAADGEPYSHAVEPAVELKNVYFRYAKSSPDVLSGLSLTVYGGEFLAVLGGNGAGKTTMLGVAAGILRAYSGKIKINGKNLREYKGGSLYRGGVALLPQDPSALFVGDTVRGDLNDMLAASGIVGEAAEAATAEAARRLGIEGLLDRHPSDISGGERQKCALAKLLLAHPRVILLDEPTKGLDAASKSRLAEIIRSLTEGGAAVIAVTHDIEFAAEHADRCALLFDGDIVSSDTPRRFFSENSFYTTEANRMARRVFPGEVTCAGVIARCRAAEASK